MVSSSYFVRSIKSDRRIDDSEVAARSLSAEARFPMRYEEKEVFISLVRIVTKKLSCCYGIVDVAVFCSCDWK